MGAHGVGRDVAMPAPPFVQCRAIARLAAPWRVQPQPNDDGIPTTTRIDESSKQEEEVIIDATHRSSSHTHNTHFLFFFSLLPPSFPPFYVTCGHSRSASQACGLPSRHAAGDNCGGREGIGRSRFHCAASRLNFRVGMPYTVKLLLSSMFIAVYLAFSFFLIALANVVLHKRYDF